MDAGKDKFYKIKSRKFNLLLCIMFGFVLNAELSRTQIFEKLYNNQ